MLFGNVSRMVYHIVERVNVVVFVKVPDQIFSSIKLSAMAATPS